MTLKEIRLKIGNIVHAQGKADVAHIEAMHEIGKLVNELQALRGYSARQSAEAEVAGILKGSGSRFGERYVRACWLLAFKLNDVQRRKILKHKLAVSDVIALTNMNSQRIDSILKQIQDGTLRIQYALNGVGTYNIRLIECPSKIGKKREYRRELGIADNSGDPQMLSAKVMTASGLDTEALADLYANSISRFGDKALACWEQALVRTGKKTAVRMAV